MSVSKQDAELTLHYYLPQIVCHTIKLCAVEGGNTYRTHWVNEIDTWMETIRSHITNIKTPKGVLDIKAIVKQVESVKELQISRIPRTKQYIEARWKREQGRSLVWRDTELDILLNDIKKWLIHAFIAMVEDTWCFDIEADKNFIALLNNYKG